MTKKIAGPERRCALCGERPALDNLPWCIECQPDELPELPGFPKRLDDAKLEDAERAMDVVRAAAAGDQPPGALLQGAVPRVPSRELRQLQELLAEFGLPTDDIATRVATKVHPDATELASRWAGYSACIDVILPDGQAMFSPWRLSQEGRFVRQSRWNSWSGSKRITAKTTRGPLVVLRVQLWRPGSVGLFPYLEGHWEPHAGKEIWDLRRVDANMSEADQQQELKRLRGQEENRGRRPGTHKYPTSEEGKKQLLADCAIVRAQLSSFGATVTRAYFAGHLGISEKTLRTTMRRLRLIWDAQRGPIESIDP